MLHVDGAHDLIYNLNLSLKHISYEINQQTARVTGQALQAQGDRLGEDAGLPKGGEDPPLRGGPERWDEDLVRAGDQALPKSHQDRSQQRSDQ